jgi:hypothetical protein
MSFIVNRPANEPGFYLERGEGPGHDPLHYCAVYKLIQKVDATNLFVTIKTVSVFYKF